MIEHVGQSAAGDRASRLRSYTLLAIASLCVALNVGLGNIVNVIKLPIYLDAIGTIMCALLAGRLGLRGLALAMLVGTVSFAISGLLFTPAVLWFIPTQIVIAAFTYFVIRPLLSKYLSGNIFTVKAVALTIVCGALLGVVAGVVSAPIITYVFGGITGSGPSVIVAILLKSGQGLFKSVLASGIASEPIDKTIQLIVAVALIRSTPTRIRSLFL